MNIFVEKYEEKISDQKDKDRSHIDVKLVNDWYVTIILEKIKY